MTKPLALVFYERLLPGSQLVNRLQDLGYRVQTIADPHAIVTTAESQKPIILLIDLVSRDVEIAGIIQQLKDQEQTSHLPIIGFAGQKNKKLHLQAVDAGADLVVFDDGLLPQLPHLLEQALHID